MTPEARAKQVIGTPCHCNGDNAWHASRCPRCLADAFREAEADALARAADAVKETSFAERFLFAQWLRASPGGAEGGGR